MRSKKSEECDPAAVPIRGDVLAGSAYQRIRTSISEGEFVPGQRVTETQLAKWLSVSRTPIREAIQRLEADGLLVHSPRQGLLVRELEYQEVVELYAMREVLEGTAAALSAQQATLPEIEILADIIESEAKLDPPDIQTATKYNKVFHETLHQSAHNRFLIDSIRALDNSMVLLGGTTLVSSERREKAIEEHRAVVSAIQARDADAARDAMARHIREAQRKRLKMIMRSRTGADGNGKDT